jgi:hypothetical protein
VRVAELISFQRSKVLDIDDNTYPIISRYRDFSLEQQETYPHASELMSESIQIKLCCFFFFLDIFFMRGFIILDLVENFIWIDSGSSLIE